MSKEKQQAAANINAVAADYAQHLAALGHKVAGSLVQSFVSQQAGVLQQGEAGSATEEPSEGGLGTEDSPKEEES